MAFFRRSTARPTPDPEAYDPELRSALARHLADRPVLTGLGEQAQGVPDGPALDALLHDGVVTFLVPAPRANAVAVHVGVGDGADLATAATAALALCDDLSAAGLQPVVTTDAGQGLWVYGVAPRPTSMPDAQSQAARMAAAVATRAPEIATVDPEQADGRVLLIPAHDLDPGPTGTVPPVDGLRRLGADVWVPAPYSVVPTARGLGVIAPLHLDEVAAVTAGMPLDLTPEDMAGRLQARGDLAAPLLERP